MREIKLRPYANEICELFEDLLDEHGITIPDEDDYQKEEDNCARLYGMTYVELEDNVVAILRKFASEIDPKCNVELVDTY